MDPCLQLPNGEDPPLYDVWRSSYKAMDEFGIGVGLYYRQLLLLGVVSVDQSQQSIRDRDLVSRWRAKCKLAISEMCCSVRVLISRNEPLPRDMISRGRTRLVVPSLLVNSELCYMRALV